MLCSVLAIWISEETNTTKGSLKKWFCMFDVVKKKQKMNFEQPIDICKQKLIQHVNSSLLVVFGFPFV